MKKILLISPYFSPAVGGVETHLDDLCEYLNSKGHTVNVRTYKALSSQYRGPDWEDRGNVHIHRLAWPDFNLNYKLDPWPVLRFLYVFTGLFFDCLLFSIRHSYEVIQAHGFIAAVIAVLLGKIFNKKVVINTHVGFKFSASGGLMNKFTQFVLIHSDHILVLTNSAKSELLSIGILESKVSVYHYWVDQNYFKPSKTKNSTNSVLFVGRLVKSKGIDTLLELAAQLPAVKFTIIGTGPEASLIKNSHLKNINFVGYVNNKSILNYYHSAKVLVIPSKIVKQTYEEGIPRVIIEALSSGLPVVATATGGIPDIFDPSMGIMVSDTTADIKSAIIHMLKSPPTSKACRATALKLFSIKNAQVIENSLQ